MASSRLACRGALTMARPWLRTPDPTLGLALVSVQLCRITFAFSDRAGSSIADGRPGPDPAGSGLRAEECSSHEAACRRRLARGADRLQDALHRSRGTRRAATDWGGTCRPRSPRTRMPATWTRSLQGIRSRRTVPSSAASRAPIGAASSGEPAWPRWPRWWVGILAWRWAIDVSHLSGQGEVVPWRAPNSKHPPGACVALLRAMAGGFTVSCLQFRP